MTRIYVSDRGDEKRRSTLGSEQRNFAMADP
jgi:hypothetical protein